MPQERLEKKRPIAVDGPIFGGYVGKKPTATRAWPDAHLLATAGMKEENKRDDQNVREYTHSWKQPLVAESILSVIHSRNTFHNPLAEPF